MVFQLSEEFKEAIAQFAHNGNTSASDVVRNAVALHIGYDLEGEEQPERRRKYATVAERNAAMKERAKRRRDEQREILEAIRRGERLEAIQAMAASLRKRDD